MFESRYFVWWSCLLATVLCAVAAWASSDGWWWGAALFAVPTFIGVVDMTQRRSSVRRNYPVMANFRFLFESIRPGLAAAAITMEHDGTIPPGLNAAALAARIGGGTETETA